MLTKLSSRAQEFSPRSRRIAAGGFAAIPAGRAIRASTPEGYELAEAFQFPAWQLHRLEGYPEQLLTQYATVSSAALRAAPRRRPQVRQTLAKIQDMFVRCVTRKLRRAGTFFRGEDNVRENTEFDVVPARESTGAKIKVIGGARCNASTA